MLYFQLLCQLDEQMKFLMGSAVHIGIGTPNRIATLLENGEYMSTAYIEDITQYVS